MSRRSSAMAAVCVMLGGPESTRELAAKIAAEVEKAKNEKGGSREPPSQ